MRENAVTNNHINIVLEVDKERNNSQHGFVKKKLSD